METPEDIRGDLGTRVRRFIGSRVNDPHAADDIAQDVMPKVRSRLDERPPGGRLPVWVFAVARNAVADYYRARAVRDHADLGDHEPVDAADDDAAHRQQAVRELTPCLLRMVGQLPEPYRTAMRLADLEGLSRQAVADRAGVSLSGAKSRVQRARRMLREMILDRCEVERDARGNVMDYETTERSAHYGGVTDEGNPKCSGRDG